MQKKRIKYTDEPMDEVEVIEDFLPKLEELAFRVNLSERAYQVTPLLTKAFKQAAKLPESDQIAFANFILAELASDLRWQQAFDNSQDLLAQLADEALAEHRANRTLELDGVKSGYQVL